MLSDRCTYNCHPWVTRNAYKMDGKTGGTVLDFVGSRVGRPLDKVDYALRIQVRPSDRGFVVKREEIVPAGIEQYEAIAWFLLERRHEEKGSL